MNDASTLRAQLHHHGAAIHRSSDSYPASAGILKAGLGLHPRGNYIALTSAFTGHTGPMRTISMATEQPRGASGWRGPSGPEAEVSSAAIPVLETAPVS
jgi:hypothetical protein